MSPFLLRAGRFPHFFLLNPLFGSGTSNPWLPEKGILAFRNAISVPNRN